MSHTHAAYLSAHSCMVYPSQLIYTDLPRGTCKMILYSCPYRIYNVIIPFVLSTETFSNPDFKWE